MQLLEDDIERRNDEEQCYGTNYHTSDDTHGKGTVTKPYR